MQTQQTITLFGTVSNPAVGCTSKNGREYTAFGFQSSPTATGRSSATT